MCGKLHLLSKGRVATKREEEGKFWGLFISRLLSDSRLKLFQLSQVTSLVQNFKCDLLVLNISSIVLS